MSLAQHIHTLTRPHLPEGATLNTSPVPSLLDQLEHATKPDAGGGAAGGSDELKIPIDAGAISLRQDIDKAARDDHYDLFGHDIGTLGGIIQAFANVVDTEWLAYLERVTGEWCRNITEYLNPTKPRRKLNMPCPSCGQHLYGPERKVALSLNCWDATETMMKPEHWDAACAACGAEWAGDDLEWLSVELTA